jgi:chromosome partitioning protein
MIIAPYRDDLVKIVILNPKGGCGKTTLATNLASYFALRGPPPTLIDIDPNGYAAHWLERRPPNSCKIHGIADYMLSIHGTRTWPLRIPKETGTVIIDTPSGLARHDIRELTYDADCILIPVLPSAFDIHATTNFIAELLLLTELERPVAVVASRTRQNTNSLAVLLRILTSLETPTIAVLRDSQNYVHAADLGLGLYELPHNRVKKDLEQMDRVIDWLDRQLMRTMKPGLISLYDSQSELPTKRYGYDAPNPFASPATALANLD